MFPPPLTYVYGTPFRPLSRQLTVILLLSVYFPKSFRCGRTEFSQSSALFTLLSPHCEDERQAGFP